MTLAIGFLIFSIAGIAGLFTLKNWEGNRGRAFAPSLRSSADMRALELKGFLLWSRREIGELPPLLVRLARVGVHDLALGFAALASWLERQAHRLADLVSHKHRFERRESRNEFLRRVSEPKNGRGNGPMSQI